MERMVALSYCANNSCKYAQCGGFMLNLISQAMDTVSAITQDLKIDYELSTEPLVVKEDGDLVLDRNTDVGTSGKCVFAATDITVDRSIGNIDMLILDAKDNVVVKNGLASGHVLIFGDKVVLRGTFDCDGIVVVADELETVDANFGKTKVLGIVEKLTAYDKTTFKEDQRVTFDVAKFVADDIEEVDGETAEASETLVAMTNKIISEFGVITSDLSDKTVTKMPEEVSTWENIQRMFRTYGNTIAPDTTDKSEPKSAKAPEKPKRNSKLVFPAKPAVPAPVKAAMEPEDGLVDMGRVKRETATQVAEERNPNPLGIEPVGGSATGMTVATSETTTTVAADGTVKAETKTDQVQVNKKK